MNLLEEINKYIKTLEESTGVLCRGCVLTWLVSFRTAYEQETKNES